MHSYDFRKLGYDLCSSLISFLPYERCAHKLAAVYQRIYTNMNETDPLPVFVTPSPAIRHLFSGS